METSAKQGYIRCNGCGGLSCAEGMPFRDAQPVIGKLVLTVPSDGVQLDELPLEAWKRKATYLK